jgi:hypothetical protein
MDRFADGVRRYPRAMEKLEGAVLDGAAMMFCSQQQPLRNS